MKLKNRLGTILGRNIKRITFRRWKAQVISVGNLSITYSARIGCVKPRFAGFRLRKRESLATLCDLYRENKSLCDIRNFEEKYDERSLQEISGSSEGVSQHGMPAVFVSFVISICLTSCFCA